MKANFSKRLLAYIIDTMFISIVVGMITIGLSTTKYTEANLKYQELTEKYTNQEITIGTYIDESGPIIYDMQKYSIIPSGITVALSIVYFVVFQYLNKGQTLGKKILKIKVVEKDNKPSLKAMILRTFIIDSIFSGVFGIALIYMLNKTNYMYGYYIVAYVEILFTFVSALFILYRKDKLGLHDIIAHTEVIEATKEKVVEGDN